MITQASEWEFTASGSTIAVFKYKSSANCSNSVFSGYVLKVPKMQKKVNTNCFFVKNVLSQFISSRYIPTSREVMITCEGTMAELLQLAGVQFERIQKSVLEIDLTIPPSLTDTMTPSFSFEFKVKCGLYSRSPFLRTPDSLIKSQMSRYQLMQRVKLHKAILKGKNPRWGAISSVSMYNPSDLMSKNAVSVRRSLGALLSSPQNNLGIRVNGRLLYGWGIVGPFPTQEIRESLGLRCDESDIVESAVLPDALARCLTRLVLQEAVFPQLERMQALDVIDVEGCSVVLRRLVELVGSLVEAEALMEECMSAALSGPALDACIDELLAAHSERQHQIPLHSISNTMTDEPGVLIASQVDESGSASASCSSRLVQLLLQFHRLTLDAEVEGAAREIVADAAESMVRQLDAADCCLLLKAWLIALTAKDMSVIVSIPGDALAAALSREMAGESHEHFSTDLQYGIGVVDYQAKPVKKIAAKVSEEEAVCRMAAAVLDIDTPCGGTC